jgi:hypothetical protein
LTRRGGKSRFRKRGIKDYNPFRALPSHCQEALSHSFMKMKVFSLQTISSFLLASLNAVKGHNRCDIEVKSQVRKEWNKVNGKIPYPFRRTLSPKGLISHCGVNISVTYDSLTGL